MKTVEQSLEEKVLEKLSRFAEIYDIDVREDRVSLKFKNDNGVEFNYLIFPQYIEVGDMGFQVWTKYDLERFSGLFSVENGRDQAFIDIAALLTPEPAEQSLEEKVQGLAQKHGIVNYAGKFRSGPDFITFMVSTTTYEISNNRLSYNSGGELEIYDIDLPILQREFSGNFCDFIVDIDALLTPEPADPSLEEKVRGWLDDVDNDGFEINPDHVLVHFSSRTDRIDCDHISDGDHNRKWHISTLDHSRYVVNYIKAIRNIATELSKHQPPKPTYEDLEQRVAELERENASLLDKFGPIDQAEQQAAEAEQAFDRFCDKVKRYAHALIELNEEVL